MRAGPGRAALPPEFVALQLAFRARPSEGELRLSIIVPTFNERQNVPELIRRLDACLGDVGWEVIVVDDDSPDGTAEVVREIACRDRRVRCLRRVGRRGLASACVEGMLASSGRCIAVIDGDLQHDESLLPRMIEELSDGGTDIVIGSRYAAGGGIGTWDQRRAAISRLAARLGRLVLKAPLSDPMSGFFMLRREVFEDAVPRLSGLGFKILLDIFASSTRPLRFKELPYRFRERGAGESKLDSHVAWDYLMMLVDKSIGHIIPARFVAFTLVGGSGVVVHLLALATVFEGVGLNFTASQAVATLVAMSSNFALNNALTYRDMRLTGWGWLRGWASFVLGCGLGGLANVGIAAYLFTADVPWLLSGLAGVLVGAVWNYAVTSMYTWRQPSAAWRQRKGAPAEAGQ